MANIPGLPSSVIPQVATRVRTMQRALSIPGGLRVLSIVGEGRREETIISSAVGDGTDGWNPAFTAASDGYGRYFRTSLYPMVENRSILYLNNSELRLLEETVDVSTFSAQYDARLDPTTGKIELQRAALVDLGGAYWKAATTNVGDGYLTTPTLVDTNAPAETWTIRCTSVIRDTYGNPVRRQATFIATGSVSGQLRDAYGQPYTWTTDGYGAVKSNGIISFGIFNPTGTIVDVGDRFTIQVSSKVLQKDDELTIKYIAEIDLEDAETFTELSQLFTKHGSPSLENTLSLGAQMAFENGATSVLALQAKPPLPRRTNEIVLPARDAVTGHGGAAGTATADDLIFYITAPGEPDTDTVVHFFVINTDGTETQIFPNKVDFYDPTITAALSTYETSGSETNLMAEFMNPGISGYVYSYTVVKDDIIEQASTDGTVTVTGSGTARFYSPSATFTAADVSAVKELDFQNTTTANEGRWEIASIVDENTVNITRGSGEFANESNVHWQLIGGSGTSQRVMLTTDLALTAGKGLRITYIDTRDYLFFDANWTSALEHLETQDLQILVCLPTQTFSAVQQAARVHVEQMSTTYYKKERVLITGALEGLTWQNVTGLEDAAVEDIGVLEGIQGDSVEEVLAGNIEDLADYDVKTNYGTSFRVLYMYPDSIVRVISGTRTTIPGYFLAPCAAGWFAGQPNIALPLTFKTLVGFTILNSKLYKETILNSLVQSGVCVVQPVTGGGKVIWGKTTTQSGAPEEEEASIVFIRDQLARTFRSVMTNFIGSPEDPTLVASVTVKSIALLNSFVSQGLLTAYKNLSVSRDTVDPRQINIVVEVQPPYIINWIFADVSIGMF